MTNEEKIDLKKEIEEQDGYEYSDELSQVLPHKRDDGFQKERPHRLEQLYLGVQQSGRRNADKAPEPR